MFDICSTGFALSIAITVILLNWYLTKRYDHWKHVGIPYVTPIPVFGSTLKLFLNPTHDVELERYKEKGRLYGRYEGRRPVLIVAEPDILRDIFVKDFSVFTGHLASKFGIPIIDNMLTAMQGEDWKRVRAIITPAFTTGKIKRMLSIFVDSAKILTSNFQTAARKGKAVDMKHYFGGFTMDVIASSAFGTKIDSHNDPGNEFATAAKVAFRNPLPWRFLLFSLCPWLKRVLKITLFSPDAISFFEKVTLQIVAERKRTNQKRNDFLQLLIDATEREGREETEKDAEDPKDEKEKKEMGHEEENEKVFSSYQSSKGLSDIELVANCVIFFLAGYDTTSSTLSHTAYELAVNPKIQERAIEEIDKAIKEKGELNYEAVREMKYLDNVIFETLRKYPPGIRTHRVAAQDYEIKYQDYHVIVPKGMDVIVPVYAIHHDPENYPDPEKYDPDRFSQEQKSSRHPYTYLPFGAGPRNCVAMRFALMEVKVCLAYVLSQCRFKMTPKTAIPLKFMTGQRFMQAKEIALKVEVRNDAVKL